MDPWGAVARFLLKSPVSISLVALGLLAFIWAALPSSAVIAGARIGLDGCWRYGVAALGLVLIGFGILLALFGVGLIGSRTEQADLMRVPVEKIGMEGPQTTLQPSPRATVSGEVTPKESGVNVWLFRENVAHQAGEFRLFLRPATTGANGHWEQTVFLWKGRFRIHAVVTTKQNDDFLRWCCRAHDAAVTALKKHVPNTVYVEGWPNFTQLPEPNVAAQSAVIAVDT